MTFKPGNIQIFPNDYHFDFMKWRTVTIGVSVLLVIAALIVISLKGLNYSIDFLGGAEIQLQPVQQGFQRSQIDEVLNSLGLTQAEVTTSSSLTNHEKFSSFVVRLTRKTGEDENATTNRASAFVQSLKNKVGNDNLQVSSMTNISGKVGKEDEYKGYLALMLSCVGILIYVAFRFDSRFAPGAVLCLAHNVLIALGFMTLLCKPFTTSSIAAFLTIVGYSINDTVIVYDRIRETRLLQPTLPMVDVVNRSISQTMNRTVLTSTTGILALIVLSLLGGGSIQDFAITMLVGIIVGTYSSIYVAAPLTLAMDKWLAKFGFVTTKTVSNANNQRPKDYAPPVVVRKKPQK